MTDDKKVVIHWNLCAKNRNVHFFDTVWKVELTEADLTELAEELAAGADMRTIEDHLWEIAREHMEQRITLVIPNLEQLLEIIKEKSNTIED